MKNKQSLLNELQNDILDKYLTGHISKKEMTNIVDWCEKMKNAQTKSLHNI